MADLAMALVESVRSVFDSQSLSMVKTNRTPRRIYSSATARDILYISLWLILSDVFQEGGFEKRGNVPIKADLERKKRGEGWC